MAYDWLDFSPPVIALGGARNPAPANSLAAFQKAQEFGVKWLASEVKITLDGVPVLVRDDAIAFGGARSGNVAELAWSDIAALDQMSNDAKTPSEPSICRLKDLMAFALSARLRLSLELKPSPGRTQATSIVTLIEAAKLWPDEAPSPLIASEDIEALVIAAQLHPAWPRGLVLKSWRDDWRELASLTQVTSLHISEDLLTPDRILQMRQMHMPILAYTVDDPARAKNLLQLGVRAVFTETPAALLKDL